MRFERFLQQNVHQELSSQPTYDPHFQMHLLSLDLRDKHGGDVGSTFEPVIIAVFAQEYGW